MKFAFALAAVLVAASLGAVAGCGGEGRLSQEEFSGPLQTIDRRGSELWGRLAERAKDLKPGEPLPADVEQALKELVDFQGHAIAELEGLNPPEGAAEPVEILVEALRERSNIFEQVIRAGRFTQQDVDRVRQAGEKIDHALRQLRERGYLPEADEHQEE